MTTYDQGDVVLVNFPFTDLTSTKKRPALVISAKWFNDKPEGDCILVAITSAVPAQLSRDEVRISDSDLNSTSLLKPSIVKAGKLFTLNQALIYRRLGSLPHRSVQRVLEKIGDIISQ